MIEANRLRRTVSGVSNLGPPSNKGGVDREYIGSIFSEIVLLETTDDREDAYLIGFENADIGNRIYSRFIRQDSRVLRDCNYYPLSIVELRSLAKASVKFGSIWNHVDEELAANLITAGLDSMAIYAITHNHPELRWLIQRPIVLLIAGEKISRFEKLYCSDESHFRHWLPDLLGVEKLTKGMIRCLSTISITSPSESVLAAKYLMSEYRNMLPFLVGEKLIDPSAVLSLKQLLIGQKELKFARWIRISDLKGSGDIEYIKRVYRDTIRLLQRSGVRQPVRYLLTSPVCFKEVEHIHYKYSRRLAKIENRRFADRTRFNCNNLPDFRDFKVVRTAGQLYRAAESLSNCAAIYDKNCVSGTLVHLLYGRLTSQRALLQIQIESDEISAVEFAGVANQRVSEEAFRELVSYKAFLKSKMGINLNIDGLISRLFIGREGSDVVARY